MQDNKELLERYAVIKEQIKLLEAQVDELQPQIMESIINEGADGVATDFGTFTVGHRRTYTYPENVAGEEARVKEMKKEAEALGTATYVEKPYLVFKSKTNAI